MIDILQQYGFRYTGMCQCDGHSTHKYAKGLYEVRWRVKRGQFMVKNNARRLSGWLPIHEAEQTLIKLFPDVAIQTKTEVVSTGSEV